VAARQALWRGTTRPAPALPSLSPCCLRRAATAGCCSCCRCRLHSMSLARCCSVTCCWCSCCTSVVPARSTTDREQRPISYLCAAASLTAPHTAASRAVRDEQQQGK
ncbi:unnamed protein product, partial [Ectocarpus sp. 8 AP-2014]